MSIARIFDRVAKEYDKQRKILIPCFDEFYSVTVRLLKMLQKDSLKILDLGTGTGLLASFILEAYPAAELRGVDISSGMLVEFVQRFTEQRVEFIQGDYLTDDLGSGYDAVVSSLSIHHLSREEKAALFRKIYVILNKNGIFINADQVLGKNSSIEKEYRRDWYEQMALAGLTGKMLVEAEDRMKEDKMSTLVEQLSWLELAGFEDVDCWYKNFNFVVFSGRKFI